MQTAFETERKFLIAMPDPTRLLSEKGASCARFVQTYLVAEKGVTHRVRKITDVHGVRYVETQKRRVSRLTAEESERAVDGSAYEALLMRADPACAPIEKTRYTVPLDDEKGHCMEIDVYPFWKNTAVLEVELGSEDETFELPTYIRIIAEVSDDGRFKNHALAKSVPSESEWQREAQEE